MADLQDLELERGGCHRDQRLGKLAIERFFAKAADDDGDVASGGHGFPWALALTEEAYAV
jgi:hypothetical protein